MNIKKISKEHFNNLIPYYPTTTAFYKGESEGVSGLAMCCLNTGQEQAQYAGLSATRLCPEYTLWAEQKDSGTCSVASQIKAFFTALTRALFGSLAQDVPKVLLSILFFTFLSSPVTHRFIYLAHDFTGQLKSCATEQSATPATKV